MVLPNYQPAESSVSRKHGLATFVHERLRYTLLDQSPQTSEIEWLCVDVDGYKIVRTPLGWVLHGRDLTGTKESCHKGNLLLDSEAGSALNSICPCQFDYVDRSCDPDILLPSLDDRRAEKIIKELCILVDGHYQIGIPWKKNCPYLPNNYNMALSRLRSLGKRLVADPELFDRYKGKIRYMISQGHAIEVLNQSENDQSKVWYIPHPGAD